MRKKSKYRPKGVRLDNMAWVTSGMKTVDQVEDAGLVLRIKNHAALTSIVKGTANRTDIDTVIGAFNMTEAFARKCKIGQQYLSEIRAAQDAVLSLSRRGVQNGDRFIFNAAEMKAVNLGMEIHDAQLDIATVRELEIAMDFIDQEIRNKRARAIVQGISALTKE